MTVASWLQLARENPVLAVGRGYSTVGALIVFASVASLAATAALEAMPDAQAMPSAFSSTIFSFQLQHQRSLAVAQASVGMLTAITGVAALRRRAWARSLAEALAWFGLLATLTIGPLDIYAWRQAPQAAFALVSGSAITIGFAVVLVVLIRFLRSAEVRAAFQVS